MKTDLQLQQDVLAELGWDPAVQAAPIQVLVEDGLVTLSGEAANYQDKWNAGLAAQRVAGVQTLVMAMTVHPDAQGQRSDTDLARAARSVLTWTDSLPPDAVHVLVEKGWLTLNGTVDWQHQREMAEAALRRLAGITGLSNHLVVQPKVVSGSVKAQIEAALQRRATRDSQEIQVEVCGADVTLTGVVHSWAERDLANHSAWGTPGVRHVEDQMVLMA